MSDAGPVRQQRDLVDALELILDKGIVINADIAITVGETELLGVELRAAIASFDTAAKYGLEFPSGTDMRRVAQESGRDPLDEGEQVDLGLRRRQRRRPSIPGRPAPVPAPAAGEDITEGSTASPSEDEGDENDATTEDDT